MSFIELTDRGFHRHGTIGTLRHAVRASCNCLRQGLHLSENQIWYFLRLSGPRPRLPLPEGVDCTRATEAELRTLPCFETLREKEARSRFALGAELWLLRGAARAAGAFWMFHGHAPLRKVRGGWLTLSSDVACLENAGASAASHNRGLVSAGWLRLAEREAQAGTRVLLAKLAQEDAAARRSAENAGFAPLACVSFLRLCLYSRVRVYLLSGDPIIDFLLEQLAA